MKSFMTSCVVQKMYLVDNAVEIRVLKHSDKDKKNQVNNRKTLL